MSGTRRRSRGSSSGRARGLGPRRRARRRLGHASEVTRPRPGPTLALVSHLDVVPPGEGWTRDPFTPVVEGDRLYGRGSGDAKASVAAMLLRGGGRADAAGLAAGRLAGDPGLRRGDPEHHDGAARSRAPATIDARGRGRADQPRARRGAARADDGGPGRPGRPAPRGLRGGRRRVHQCGHSCSPATSLRLDGLFDERTHPVLGRDHRHADDARGRREPERHPAGRARRCSTSAARRPGPTTRSPTAAARRGSTCEVVVTSRPAGALRDAGRLAPARGRSAGASRRSRTLRQPDLLRLGVPPPRRRDQVRTRHQPALAHAG